VGNPYAKRVAAIRDTLLATVTDQDVQEVTAALLTSAKSGDIPAIRELLDRLIGRPTQTDLLQRVEALETLLAERDHSHVAGTPCH
jgi:hypothetical protein